MGTYNYFVRLLEKLGCPVNDHIRYYLANQQKIRATRIAQYKKKEIKKKRNTKLHAKLKEYSEKIKRETAAASGCVYQPGIGMDGGYCQPTHDGGDSDQDGAAGQQASALSVCNACGVAGHKRKTNRLCSMYETRGAAKKTNDTPPVALVVGRAGIDGGDSKPAATEEDTAIQDADEQELMDGIPFEETDDEFFDALEAADDADDIGAFIWIVN